MKALEIKEIEIEKIKPYKNNTKEHPKEQINKIAESIKEMGFNDPIAVDENNEIIEGHGRLLAAMLLGLKIIPIIVLEHLSEVQKKQYRIAHNKLTMSSGFNLEILKLELEDIISLGGEVDITALELNEIEKLELSIDGEQDMREEIIPKLDNINIRSSLGDLYILGEHRLLCGNSTIKFDVLKLLGEEKGQLIVTDPPYNVNYTGSTEDELTIKNDNLSEEDFKEFLKKSFDNMKFAVEKGAGIYVFHADTEGNNFRTAMKEAGFYHSQTCIWVKNSIVMGRQDYHWKHEPILVGWSEGGSHNWYSDRKQSTIWEFNKPSKNDIHPTMKPIDLISYPISNSSKKGDIVVDFFGGSGSTLIACENIGRKCRMMELDPIYVDAIVKRFFNMTGKKIKVLKNGETEFSNFEV